MTEQRGLKQDKGFAFPTSDSSELVIVIRTIRVKLFDDVELLLPRMAG